MALAEYKYHPLSVKLILNDIIPTLKSALTSTSIVNTLGHVKTCIRLIDVITC